MYPFVYVKDPHTKYLGACNPMPVIPVLRVWRLRELHLAELQVKRLGDASSLPMACIFIYTHKNVHMYTDVFCVSVYTQKNYTNEFYMSFDK